MFKQSLFIDIWTALYQLAIASRQNEIACLVPEQQAWRVIYQARVTAEGIDSLASFQPIIIVVNRRVTKCTAAPHHEEYFRLELAAALKA